MDLFQAIILGIVQGLTEFAPVSSSAHLVLVPWLLGWPEPGLAFDTMLHLGTLVAVISVFWRDLWVVLRDWLQSLIPGHGSTPYSRLGWLLIIGTMPAAFIGYFLKDFFEQLFSEPMLVGVFLLCTAAFLVGAERLSRQERDAAQLSTLGSFLIGFGQAVAIAPGISRSGATMSVGLLLGLGRAESARFSFLLSTPIILGAAASQVKDLIEGTAGNGVGVNTMNLFGISFDSLFIVGFLSAAISGYLCISLLLAYLRRRSFHAFAVYCAVVGVGVILVNVIS